MQSHVVHLQQEHRLKISRALLSLVVASSVVAQAQAAKKREGRSPVNDNVCAPLKAPGVTRALYGLCVGYCGAMACGDGRGHSHRRRGDEHECRAPNPRVLEIYNQTKAATDPDMPCVRPTCPCWNPSEIASVGQSFPGSSTSLALVSDATTTITDLQESASDAATASFAEAAVVTSIADVTTTTCQYLNISVDLATGATSGTVNVQEITPTQGLTCQAQVASQVTRLRRRGISVPCSGNLCGP
jgi:hypothetical protein